MISRFKKFVTKYNLINESDSIALAISGGKDSVFCAYMLERLSIPFFLIHCNFKLRDSESDDDEQFVTTLASQLTHCKGLFNKSFETTAYAETQKITIQEAARNLRYNYFEELYNQQVFNKLITAHHKSDLLETFLINLNRVSGIEGLKSIPRKRDYFIRPLMEFTSSEIILYLKENKINYREDSSNLNDKYLRNKIRNKILPQLKNHLPDFEENALKSINILKKENDLFQYLIKEKTNEISEINEETRTLLIDIKKLLSFPQSSILLYHILDKHHFNHSQCEQIVESCNSNESGKIFNSKTHQLVVDRSAIKLVNINPQSIDNVTVSSEGNYQFGETLFSIKKTNSTIFNNNPNEEIIELPLSHFPLTLRPWQTGDYIYPLGMKGKKLISDFFIDEKIDVIKKAQILMLARGKEVLWICGYRISEKVKIKSGKNIYRVLIGNA